MTDEQLEAKRKAWREKKRAYRATEGGRAATKTAFSRYIKTPKGKAAKKRCVQRRSQTAAYKAYRKAYRERRQLDGTWADARRASQKKYRESQHGRIAKERWHQSNAAWHRFTKQLVTKGKGKPSITLDQYHAKSEAQDFQCAICYSNEWPLHIDHCHARGHLRGLLCNRCNNGLGRFRDDPDALRRAADYLNRFAMPRTA